MVGKESLALALNKISVGRLNFRKMKPDFGFPPIFPRRIRISWSFLPQTLVNDSSRIFYYSDFKASIQASTGLGYVQSIQ